MRCCRVRDMTATLGDLERSRSDERQRFEELRRKNEHLRAENTALKKVRWQIVYSVIHAQQSRQSVHVLRQP